MSRVEVQPSGMPSVVSRTNSRRDNFIDLRNRGIAGQDGDVAIELVHLWSS